MDKEVQLLLSVLDSPVTVESQGLTLQVGCIGAHTVAVGKCGIGKVNAALNSFKTIRTFKPDLVINSGVAGGAGIPIGSVLVADRVAYDDVWCGPGTEYGQADGFPRFMIPSERILDVARKNIAGETVLGLICTGDKFISTPGEIAFIREVYPDVKAVDMESAAIAQTCLSTGTEFAIVRVVSDTPGEGENISQYRDFWTQAPSKTFETLCNIIKVL